MTAVFARSSCRRQGAGIRPPEEFHADPTYAGHLHRAGMAWAKHAARCGRTMEEIKDELLEPVALAYAAEEGPLLVMADSGRRDLMQGESPAFAMSEVVAGLHGDGDADPRKAIDQRAIKLK